MKLLSKMAVSVAFGLCSLITPAFGAGLLVPANALDPTGLQIKSHEVSVVVEEGYAITEVNQVFHNPEALDLEASYRFPVPDKAAVSEFTVWIDGQPVVGEVLEKEQARTVYQEEKAAGREAGLAEKNKHYNFEITVTPVRAGQDTRIRLVYMQPINIDTGIGRYVYPLEPGGTDDAASAFWMEQSVVQERLSFDFKLRSSNSISGLRLPAHPQASINQTNVRHWQASFNNFGSSAAQITGEGSELTPLEATQPTQAGATAGSTAGSLDTDIVVYWRIAPDTPASVDLVTHKESHKDTGTFMLTLSPGDDLAPITEGRDWMFVLDTSGSMENKYATLVDGVQRALGQLNPQDRFRIVRFSNSSDELTRDWVVANESEVAYWGEKLAATHTSGGTNLYAGMTKGLRALDADRTSVIVLVTDGEANVGVQEKKKFLSLMQDRDVRLFTAMMGNGANRPLLQAMTEVSNGFAVGVSNSDDIVGKLLEFTSKVTHEAMHDIDLSISGVRTRNLTPKVTKTLYRGEQLTVFGHYQGSGRATVTLSAKVSGEPKEYKAQFDLPVHDNRNPEIERLWAYASIRDMQDMIDYLGDASEYRSAIIDTAVEYGLVTNHTSMIVIRDEQFEARNIDRKNRDRQIVEVAAAKNRQSQPIRNTRVDQSAPAFNGPRSSHGQGSGSMGLELILLLMLLVVGIRRRKYKVQCSEG